MNLQKTRESIQQEREKARAEYEKVTKGLLFTKDFHKRQEVLMHDSLATVGERVMAYILRRSWGEMVLYAMKEDGQPAYQRDIERELGLNKKSVSRAVAYHQARGYLEEHPKLLYPVISPALTAPDPDSKKSQEYETFLADWKVSHSSDFQALEVARSTIKKIRKVILSDYKKSREQKQSEAASLLETEESNVETGKLATVSPFEASNQRHKTGKNQPKTPSVDSGTQSKDRFDPRAYLFQRIAWMQGAFKDSEFAFKPIDPNLAEHKQLVKLILEELGDQTEDNLIGFVTFVAAQFKGTPGGRRRSPNDAKGPKGLGLLVNWARDYARIAGRSARGASND